MDRRSFLKAAVAGAAAIGTARAASAAEKFFPSKVDQNLFEGVNRVKDAGNETPLERSHAPAITAPDKVKAGEPFQVEISIGKVLHPMGPAHWIEFIALNIGNEPAGRINFQPRGYLNPKTTFTVVLSKEAAPSGKVTLVAQQRCNLHGLWESSKDIEVS